VHHQPDHVGGNGKTNTVRAAGTGEDGRVDADHAGRHVNQCAAGVAGVDRSIGLDVDLRVRVTDLRAAERGDYAARYGLADAERVADGQHHVAHFDGIGVLKFQVGEAALPALDAQHSDVRLVVELHDLGIELTTVGQCDADFRRPTDLDDVRVGNHHPFGGDDHSRPQRVLDALLWHAKALAEKAPKQGIVSERRHEGGHTRAHIH